MDAAAELGRNPVRKHQIQPEYHMEMSRLTRDGTAEPVSRDQILRHARGQGNIIFPVQLTTSSIGNLTRLIHTLLYVMTIHTYSRPPGYPFRASSLLFSAPKLAARKPFHELLALYNTRSVLVRVSIKVKCYILRIVYIAIYWIAWPVAPVAQRYLVTL